MNAGHERWSIEKRRDAPRSAQQGRLMTGTIHGTLSPASAKQNSRFF
jgi:hypothetical protein